MFGALGIDHEMSMRHIVFCGLSGSAAFFHGTIFEKMLLNLACVFWFALHRSSEKFLIQRKTERYMIKDVQYIGIHVEYP